MKNFLLCLSIVTILCAEAQSPLNTALSFDGTSQSLKITGVGNFLETPPLTIEAWIRPQGGTQDKLILGGINNNAWAFYLTNPLKLEFGKVGNSAVPSSTNVSPNTWSHVAVTYDGAHVKLYVNGVLSEDITGYTPTFNSGNSDYSVAKAVAVNQYYAGGIDEIRVWNVIRTATEINVYKCEELTGNEAGLLLYYKFNETTGTIAQDGTSNSHNALSQVGTLNSIQSVPPSICIVGIDETTTADNFGLYPNPGSSWLNIKNITPEASIVVTNPLGEELIKQTAQNENVSIYVGKLPAGIYFVNGKKFIKE